MEQRNYKLYLHITPNGKRYYGITKQDVKRRWAKGKGYKNNQHFTRAIEKYGWDNIDHIVLFDSLTEYEAKELEQYFIQWYDTANPQYGYNQSLGGEGGNHSERTKQKMSDNHADVSGKNNPMYGRTGIDNPNYGRQHSEKSKQKMSDNHANVSGKNNPMHGKHHSEESRQKSSKANAGKNSSKIRPIICITTKKIFYGTREAERQCGVKHSSVSSCCKGKLKSAGKLNGQKLVWRYLNHKHNKRYRIKNELGEL